MIGFGFNFLPMGSKNFYYEDNKLKHVTAIYPRDIAELHQKHIVGDLFSGLHFLEMVDTGCIINYDGSLGNIFIDEKYITNLGLRHKDFSQGDFQVDKKTWEDICFRHRIMVEWCNR